MKIKSNTTNNDIPWRFGLHRRPSSEENETNSSSGSCLALYCWHNLPGEWTSQHKASITHHRLSASHFLGKYLTVPHWQFLNLGLKLTCFTWLIMTDNDWRDLTFSATASEVTTLWWYRNVYYLFSIIIVIIHFLFFYSKFNSCSCVNPWTVRFVHFFILFFFGFHFYVVQYSKLSVLRALYGAHIVHCYD